MTYLHQSYKFVSVPFLQLRHVRLSVVCCPWYRMKFNSVASLKTVQFCLIVKNSSILSDHPSRLHLARCVEGYFHSTELSFIDATGLSGTVPLCLKHVGSVLLGPRWFYAIKSYDGTGFPGTVPLFLVYVGSVLISPS